ncbi:TRAP transporter permease [Anaerotruncus rubiinfantis]|uniref:TRAP transporter permease n=1 Tax=Anaerotruncus rubiinfantis TaxID=1720200 RepID=UPI001FAB0A41|nr:TRAP transporter permease [Anaerotruncus rubiinfantis]
MADISKKETTEMMTTTTDAAAVEAEVVSEEEVQAVLKKYDREANTRLYTGVPKSIIRYLLAAYAVYCVLLNFLFNWETCIERASFVGGLVFFAFLLFPASKKGTGRTNYIPWYDVILALCGSVPYFYFVANCTAILNQGIALTPFQVVLGAIGIICTMEACRRSVGLPIVIVSALFIVYAMTKKPLLINVYNLFYTSEGVIGTPIRACSTFIVLFVIFGSFLEKTGISQFFIDLANSIAGSSSGGPAKVAVISSALCGMVSGSSVGNTLTTGAVTIPLMKRNGYKPEFAGAVEAAASTGGQIMPPIMGAAAFLMVEYSGYEYGAIALRAVLPAALYFAGIFIAVHLEAHRLGLHGVSRDQLPRFWNLLFKKGYLLLPLISLVFMIMKTTMALAAIVATILSIIVSMFHRETRINLTKFFDALENGARSTVTVGVACAVAGIIACVITTTGIGSKLISAIVSMSGGNLFVGMVLTMFTCIVLGMGVPTTANYVIMATTCAPILITMGMETLAAHMFVFYFGIVADITPPVAMAAYAGSAIAKSKPMKTAFNAVKLAIGAFIVPYCFGLNPAMLFINTAWYEVVLITLTSLLGIFGVAAGLGGYIFRDMKVWERAACIIGGLCMMDPGLLTDLVGFALIGGIFMLEAMERKKVRLNA